MKTTSRLHSATRSSSGAPCALLLLSLMLGLLSTGCGSFPMITGSGNLVTKEYDLTDFSRVSAGSSFQIEITRGAKHAVTVTADDNLMEHLEVSRSAETLHLGVHSGFGIRNATLKASVSMPELTAVNLSGAAHASITGFTSERAFQADLSGASNLRGDIRNAEADFDLSGASHIALQGSASTLKVTASGASNAELEGYPSTDTRADASGASHILVHPSGKLSGHASGASSIRYVGEPSAVESHASGASSVQRK